MTPTYTHKWSPLAWNLHGRGKQWLQSIITHMKWKSWACSLSLFFSIWQIYWYSSPYLKEQQNNFVELYTRHSLCKWAKKKPCQRSNDFSSWVSPRSHHRAGHEINLEEEKWAMNTGNKTRSTAFRVHLCIICGETSLNSSSKLITSYRKYQTEMSKFVVPMCPSYWEFWHLVAQPRLHSC